MVDLAAVGQVEELAARVRTFVDGVAQPAGTALVTDHRGPDDRLR